ncbi:MAG: enoyl-CoA hydratase/isomerase family protein [Candidatus Thermoplasmatota archaeon]|nr:enoyl-CoA hydratase/isomerase family protein [Candidatus Thermoplasmatota archaeon]MCL5438120.1 enoyl-CoA hydratase/isomerase family protein [Candidatus Thermoplasmatota archaeon]
MAENPSIETSEEEPLVRFRLKNPGKLNAITQGMAEELIALLSKYGRDPRYRAILMGGSGGNYSSGADITAFSDKGPEEALRFHQVLNEVVRSIRSCPKPVIAVLEGYSLGGGLEIAESADIRIASESARIGQPEINIGINAGAGGNVVLPDLVGRGMAMYLILTGRKISGPEAMRIGLVDLVFPADSVWKEAEKIAQEIASKPPATVQAAKSLVNRSRDMSLDSALESEASAFSMLFATQETRERIGKFLNREKT